MLCFRDRSWCVQSLNEICSSSSCTRFFTQEDREQAIIWWGGEDFPLSIGDFKTKDCGYENSNRHGTQ